MRAFIDRHLGLIFLALLTIALLGNVATYIFVKTDLTNRDMIRRFGH